MQSLTTYQSQEREVIDSVRGTEPAGGRASSLFAQAEVLRIQRRLAEAFAVFQQALADDPESPLARAGMALMTSRRGTGMDSLKEITATFPDLQRPHVYLAKVETLSGRASSAAERLRIWSQRTPQDAVVWDALAAALAGMKDKVGAAAAAARVLELAPGALPLQTNAMQVLASCGERPRARRLARQLAQAFGGRARLLPWVFPLLGRNRIRMLLTTLVLAAILVGVVEVVPVGLGLVLGAGFVLFCGWQLLMSHALDIFRISREVRRLRRG